MGVVEGDRRWQHEGGKSSRLEDGRPEARRAPSGWRGTRETCLIYSELAWETEEWRVSGTPSIALRTRGEQLWVLAVWEQMGYGEEKGDGGAFFFSFRKDNKGVAGCCPCSIQARLSIWRPIKVRDRAWGTRRKKGWGKRSRRKRSERDALSPHSSLLLQSGYLLDPRGRLSASLHTNSSLPQPWTWAKNIVGLNQRQVAQLMAWLYERV